MFGLLLLANAAVAADLEVELQIEDEEPVSAILRDVMDAPVPQLLLSGPDGVRRQVSFVVEPDSDAAYRVEIQIWRVTTDRRGRSTLQPEFAPILFVPPNEPSTIARRALPPTLGALTPRESAISTTVTVLE